MRLRGSIICFLIFTLTGIAVWAGYDTGAIEVKHYRLSNSPLAESLAGKTVAFISDLHIRTIGPREEKVLGILSEEKPDLILLGGDYISFRAPYEAAVDFLKRLQAPLGVYGVLGNTEYSNENGACILCHQEKSRALQNKRHPEILRNSSVILRLNGKEVTLLGLDDPVTKENSLAKIANRHEKGNPAILLAHSPAVFEEAANLGIDLMLSGHNHGGQFFFAKYLGRMMPFADAGFEYLDGFYQKGKSLLYVSRGVGTSFLPLRLGVKPEIAFFRFERDREKSSNDRNFENGGIRNTAARKKKVVREPGEEAISSSVANPTLSLQTISLKTVFSGLPLTDLWARNPEAGRTGQSPVGKETNPENVLFDFESEAELDQVNWECRKWFELSKDHFTHGKTSLKVSLPPGRYPGVKFHGFRKDWTGFRFLKLDVFNPSREKVRFHVRIDDEKSRWEYARRFDRTVELSPGANALSFSIESIRTNMTSRPLEFKKISNLMMFVLDNRERKDLYIDYIRLE